MNIKRSILLIVITFFACIFITISSFKFNIRADLDVVAVNDISQSLVAQWEQLIQMKEIAQGENIKMQEESGQGEDLEHLNESGLPGLQYGYDYVVIDQSDKLIAATRDGLNEELNAAIRHRDTIVDLRSNSEILGKLIIYNDSSDKLEEYRSKIQIYIIVILAIAAALCIGYAVYYDRTIFRPFRKLKSFAIHVAEGNLDLPLEMDQGNVFGAFTESFDLMRDEINRARINERMANQSKRELVASLSHDIKTPVASIIAVSELMYARSADDTLKNQIEIINSKADQINTLITNLFNATLEELQELKVTVTEQSSRCLYELIRKADYNNQVTIASIHECLILMDELRLAQVIDNVLSNSYKYAGTSIEVYTQLRGRYLEVFFKDYGLGVPEEERTLIFNKFYRAKNAVGKSGTGLGLYISKYILNKMSGDIDCGNVEDGFVLKIKLKIV